MDPKRARGHVGSLFVYYPTPLKRRGRWRFKRIPIGGETVEELALDVLPTASKKAARDAVQKLADDERAAAEAARLDPAKREPSEIGFRAGLDAWRAAKFSKKEASTQREYEFKAQRWWKLLGENVPISSIDFPKIQTLFSTWLDSLEGSTKLAHVKFMRRAWRWFVKMGYARTNVPDLLMDEEDTIAEWRQEKNDAPPAGRALEHAEVVKLLEAARLPYERTMQRHKGKPNAGKRFTVTIEPPAYLFPALMFAFHQGVREENLFHRTKGMTWADLVDLDKPGKEVLFIDKTRMKAHADLIVPLHRECAEALRAWRDSLDPIPHPKSKAIVFASTGKTSRERKRARVVIRRALETARVNAGIAPLTIHDARRTVATRFNEANPGADLERQAFLGHKAPGKESKTSKVDAGYVRIKAEALRPFVEKMPRFFPAAGQATTEARAAAEL